MFDKTNAYIYVFWGKVKVGKKRGKFLGYPTVNVALTKKIPEGIYISQTKIGNKFYPSTTFIGAAITFSEKNFQAETYIIDFDKSLYNKWISVKLLKKIRNNIKFESSEKLVKQMEKDVAITKNYFKI